MRQGKNSAPCSPDTQEIIVHADGAARRGRRRGIGVRERIDAWTSRIATLHWLGARRGCDGTCRRVVARSLWQRCVRRLDPSDHHDGCGLQQPGKRAMTARPRNRRRFRSAFRPCLAIFAIALPVIPVVQSLSAWMPTLIGRGYGTGVPRAAILGGAVTLLKSLVDLLLFDRHLSFAPRPLFLLSGRRIIACAGVWGLTYADSLRSTLLAFAVVNIVLGIAMLTCLATLQQSIRRRSVRVSRPCSWRSRPLSTRFAAKTPVAPDPERR